MMSENLLSPNEDYIIIQINWIEFTETSEAFRDWFCNEKYLLKLGVTTGPH